MQKNNYGLLIAQEPAENARSDRGRARETFARWVLVCADGGTALNHCTKKNRYEEPCVQTPGSTGAEASISTAHTHSPFQMKLMWILLFSFLFFLLPLLLFVWLSFFSSLLMGKWRVFGSYLDNSHIFPRSPSCFRGGSTSGPAIEPVRNPAVCEPFGTTLSSHCSRITGALWDKKQPKSIVSLAE